ncbi:putative transposase for insertion sequence element IS701 [Actinoplanes sp. SE50]|nr:putative transposase for insertion sequence element IS701 [Actinoplanes sp. SE50/110]ATO81467.1 putative transposase for insertion sequence element IS701 [Actinoplanes sp. SE50]SLL98874.1 transposase [Actinoplanes sp. SE50/110]
MVYGDDSVRSPQETRVSAFVDEMFGDLGRADQRRWARIYLRGMLTARGKKTVQEIARSVGAESFVARGLRQFINFSPWDWGGPRRRLAEMLWDAAPGQALTVAVSAIPKRGSQSVGVQRRFVVAAGRTVNCQLVVSLFLATGRQLVPVDWELVLGPEWGADRARRARARIPDSVEARPVWRHVLDVVRRSARFRAGLPLVADLSELDEVWPLVVALAGRRELVIAVSPGQRIPACRAGRPGDGTSPTVGELLQAAAAGRARHSVTVPDPDGTPRTVAVQSVALRGGRGADLWLLGEWSPESRRFTRYWLTNRADRPGTTLELGRYADRTAGTLAELRRDFGVLDYEGRSFPGWHHHMTMVSAAYTLQLIDVCSAVLQAAGAVFPGTI